MYGRADRLLHHVALGFRPLLDATFDLERARWGRAVRALPVERPVFIAGLARAGTSILTRICHEGGGFACASYRDLPFPLAPNSWARLGGKRWVETRERGHGDGLTHDLDSPEAIEEVFWRLHEGEAYRRAEGLAPVAPRAESIPAFRDYVRLVLHAHGGGRYLSKNNNNVLRLAALVEAFPDAVLLHPFRDPLQQALSLRTQHLRACALADEDPFRRRFMTWLGHHEFGADQRPFLFAGAPGAEEDRGRVDYWLKLWISVYEALLASARDVRDRQLFLDYDALCAEPLRYAHRLGALIGAPIVPERLAPPPLRAADVGQALLERATVTHSRLRERFAAAFG